MVTPSVVISPARVPRAIEERTTAMKSGPGSISAGMKIAKTLTKAMVQSIDGFLFPRRYGQRLMASTRLISVSERPDCCIQVLNAA